MTTEQSSSTEASAGAPGPSDTPAGAGQVAGEADRAGPETATRSGDGERPSPGPTDEPDADLTGGDLTDGTGDPAGRAVAGDREVTAEPGVTGDDTATGGVGDDNAAGDAGEGAAERTPDPWGAFGPAPEEQPGRARRAVRAAGRVLVHEWTLASLASLLLAVAMTWPALGDPTRTIPQDYWDPTLQAWQMAWSGHILLTDPTQLFHSNTFYPEQWSFAFSDMLLGYAPFGMLGTGPQAAVLRYNVVFVLAHALAALGAYALARQVGAGRIGAAVAGVGYAYAPWLLSQAGHLHVISNGGIPLSLAMLARGHGWSLRHGYRPERRRWGWALAGWLVASWQISLGFGIGLPFAYILGLTVLVAAVAYTVKRIRSRAHPFGWRLLVTDVVGGSVFAATGALLSIPFFKVAELHPYAKRSVAEVEAFSPPFSGFFVAPGESRIWGELHAPARALLPWPAEMTLLPGFVLYGLAAAGLVVSVWTLRQRLLLLAGVLVTGVLAMGTRFFGGTWTYLLLFENLPGWDGLRTPSRLTLWTTLLLGLLAAGAVSAFCQRAREVAAQRIPPWPGPWLRLATLLPLLLVLIEGLNVTPHPVVPPQPAALRAVEGPLLVLPSDQGVDQNVMLWSTSRFQPVVNGGSGFTPQRLTQTREVAQSFPDQASVDYLRGLGVRTVVVLRDRIAGTPLESTVDLPVDGLGVRREQVGDTLVFHL
jgi:hypothetical protein